MTVTVEQVLLIAIPAVAGLTWLLRLEGRINLADARHTYIQEALHEIKTDVKKLLGEGV